MFDQQYLEDRKLGHEITIEAGMVCVVFRNWKLPAGYDRTEADLLVRLPSGYPDLPPDMWWFSPGVHLSDGTAIQATECIETYLGRPWQRWSRHFSSGQWTSGVDSLESFLAIIAAELIHCSIKDKP